MVALGIQVLMMLFLAVFGYITYCYLQQENTLYQLKLKLYEEGYSDEIIQDHLDTQKKWFAREMANRFGYAYFSREAAAVAEHQRNIKVWEKEWEAKAAAWEAKAAVWA